MGDYQTALSFHQEALDIQENVQCDSLDRATTYVNLGETYREMKDYTMALTYYQKGMEIRENKLQKNHCSLAVIHHNLAKLYLDTQQCDMATKNVQEALELLRKNDHQIILILLTIEKLLKKFQKKLLHFLDCLNKFLFAHP